MDQLLCGGGYVLSPETYMESLLEGNSQRCSCSLTLRKTRVVTTVVQSHNYVGLEILM
jgi:hypothetical protein